MIRLYLLAITLFISTHSLHSQTNKPTSYILRYQNVIEFTFDESKQDYIPSDTISYSGAISVDPTKIFIKGYNQEENKILKIIEVQEEDGTNRDMFLCEMNGKRYAIAITPDKRYLTQIGINDKFIYELVSAKTDKQQIEIVNLKNDPNTEAIYTIVEKMPLFNGSTDQEESYKLLYKYIKYKVKEDTFNAKGIIFINFVVNRKGETENIRVLRGINAECDKKSIKYIKEMPNWTPGEHNGKKANVQYTIPIKIK